MEDQEKRTEEEQEDVEAHGRRKTNKAADEPSDETREDDDVELHGRRKTNK